MKFQQLVHAAKQPNRNICNPHYKLLAMAKANGIHRACAASFARLLWLLVTRPPLSCLIFLHLVKPTKFTGMAPQTRVQCFAAKDKKAKLERWDYEPVPLQPHDIGAASIFQSTINKNTTRQLTSQRNPSLTAKRMRLQRFESLTMVSAIPTYMCSDLSGVQQSIPWCLDMR